MRYRNVLIAGVIAGVGGAFFTIGSDHNFSKNMTVGKGFIALAALIFGRWSPIGATLAALLFGFSQAACRRTWARSTRRFPPQFLDDAAVRGDDPRGGRLRRPGASARRRRQAVRKGLRQSGGKGHDTMDIDWDLLRAAATDAMKGAYAPYSRFPVGAAALVDDGRIVRGCNVENASYGLTLCAECGVVSALHASGGGRLVALSCVDGTGAPLMPCGRCRQLLWEHGGPQCLVDAPGGPLAMAELLPYAFGAGGPRAAPRPRTPSRRRTCATCSAAAPSSCTRTRSTAQRVWTAYWDGSTGVGHGRSAILDEAPSRADAADVIAWGLARTRRVIVVDAEGEMFWAGEGPAPAEVSRPWQS